MGSVFGEEADAYTLTATQSKKFNFSVYHITVLLISPYICILFFSIKKRLSWALPHLRYLIESITES